MSDPYEKKRLRREQQRLARERELRRHILMAFGAVAAVLAVILIVLTVHNRRQETQQTINLSAGAAVQQTAEAAGDTAAAEQTGTEGTVISGTLLPAGDGALSTVSSAEEAVESEAEETVGWTLLPIEEQELVYTDTSVDWNLMLVNPTHRITEDFYVDVATLSFSEEYYFDARAVDALDEMLYDCRNEGYTPIVRAGYRSWNTQQGLYDNKVEEWMYDEGYSREEAEEIAATIVALPGTSEHQLGLAVDIASEGYDKLNSSQADAPTQQWLTAHCAEYGFILRFPYGKSDYTGIIWEPWHYRYVGKEAAQEIMERGICLEEYLAEKGIGN